MDIVEHRVRRSVLLLDEWKPGWAAQVDVARLDLGSGRWCVLGQVYGDYVVGVMALCRRGEHLGGTAFHQVAGGAAAWAAEIARRTQPTPAPESARELVAV